MGVGGGGINLSRRRHGRRAAAAGCAVDWWWWWGGWIFRATPASRRCARTARSSCPPVWPPVRALLGWRFALSARDLGSNVSVWATAPTATCARRCRPLPRLPPCRGRLPPAGPGDPPGSEPRTTAPASRRARGPAAPAWEAGGGRPLAGARGAWAMPRAEGGEGGRDLACAWSAADRRAGVRAPRDTRGGGGGGRHRAAVIRAAAVSPSLSGAGPARGGRAGQPSGGRRFRRARRRPHTHAGARFSTVAFPAATAFPLSLYVSATGGSGEFAALLPALGPLPPPTHGAALLVLTP
jgi:hypothetical protein